MPIMRDKSTGQYWRAIGEGLTPDIGKAANYSYGQAQALLRLYGDTTTYLSPSDEAGQWVEHEYVPEPRSTPIRTQQMKDKNLIWVSLGDVWLAADIQSLTMASMLVLNGATPHTKPHGDQRTDKPDLSVVPNGEGPSVA
jgi:hypothetical protein